MTQQTNTSSVRPAANSIFDAEDALVAWIKANPEAAARELRRLRVVEVAAQRAAYLESWRTNPERMGR